MWILMVITWIAITAIAIYYAITVAVVTPDANMMKVKEPIMWVIVIMIYGWLILMALLLIAHTIRMILKLVKKIRKAFRRRRFDVAAPPQHGNNHYSLNLSSHQSSSLLPSLFLL
ncbi:hypothetical protein C2S52_007909 [Perilla frutescens var. hirtella]|nr:hypothetical protein C2S51_018302 [Perilla frutescens var. frutescens]KAH6782950.1 hypothetical protein C2S52_007909 [Perilla frutescens var. hirtella]